MKKKEKRIIDKQFKGNTNPEIATITKIAIGVLVFFGLVYLISGILTGNIKIKKEETKEVEVQYSEILAEQTFKQKGSEYYVLYYNFDSNLSSYIEILSSGLSKTVYKVDLDKKFNKNFISEKVNYNPKNASDLKVKNPTLIRIKNKKAIKVVEGIENIKKYLAEK